MIVSNERPRTDVPRLGASDRVGWLPAKVVYWCVAGFLSGLWFAQIYAAISPTYTIDTVWNIWWLWPLWGFSILCSLGMAFVNPGGISLPAWARIRLSYRLQPKKAAWS
jgi:hypothetical protein